ncbi:MAG TPA: branched-chain amino acid transaminase [Streptosporangiaceae bacterium]|nr:branched-chain amino acid transaminase [Streptosporangiaceae bacterium]
MTVTSLGAEQGHLDYLWWNGRIINWEDARIHVNAVGHASVSSVFEGIKAYWSDQDGELYVFRLEDHIRRLFDSIRIGRLGTHYSSADLCDGVLHLLAANNVRSDTYIRPWLFAAGLVHEHLVPAGVPTECVIDTWPFETSLLTERSCRACVSSWWRISDNSMPPRLKTFSNYHNGRLGMVEARANGYDWPVFLNERGKVTEGPGACLILVRDGRVITPSLTSGVLGGITRDTVLQLAREDLGLAVEDREVDRTELYVADELFFVGTGWEILPIATIDDLTVGDGAMGPVSRALDEIYHAAVRGQARQRQGWLTPVWASLRAEQTPQVGGR